jgi:mannose-6-phosphate isomerase-like protein (cupin superfamily)
VGFVGAPPGRGLNDFLARGALARYALVKADGTPMRKPRRVRHAGKPAAKKAAPKKRAARTARRSRGKVARSRPAKAKAAPRKQRFVFNHLDANSFDAGLRSYAQYRDLDIAAATNGLVRAHVIKMVPPCIPAVVSKRHFHDVEFQMVYVLKGWIKSEFDGAGAVTMREGSCWMQPPKIKHSVLDYSDDCELLEIIMPADFGTVELE